MSLAIWDHTVLPATWHKWAHPALIPARGRYSIYLPRWTTADRFVSWWWWWWWWWWWIDDGLKAELTYSVLSVCHIGRSDDITAAPSHFMVIGVWANFSSRAETSMPDKLLCSTYLPSNWLKTGFWARYLTGRNEFYRVVQKVVPQFYFWDNFPKCTSILITHPSTNSAVYGWESNSRGMPCWHLIHKQYDLSVNSCHQFAVWTTHSK